MFLANDNIQNKLMQAQMELGKVLSEKFITIPVIKIFYFLIDVLLPLEIEIVQRNNKTSKTEMEFLNSLKKSDVKSHILEMLELIIKIKSLSNEMIDHQDDLQIRLNIFEILINKFRNYSDNDILDFYIFLIKPYTSYLFNIYKNQIEIIRAEIDNLKETAKLIGIRKITIYSDEKSLESIITIIQEVLSSHEQKYILSNLLRYYQILLFFQKNKTYNPKDLNDLRIQITLQSQILSILNNLKDIKIENIKEVMLFLQAKYKKS